MQRIGRGLAGRGGALVFLTGVAACGESAPTGGSRISLPEAGAAGAGGATPVFNIDVPGGGGAGGSAGGAATSVTLHSCPSTPDPSCPTSTLDASFDSRDAPLTDLEGVTEITGALTIRDLVDVGALQCLERVGDDVKIDLFGGNVADTLWGLRNLRFVGGGVEIDPQFDEIQVDCGLRRLESLGSAYLTGGAVDVSSGPLAGELDLSRITEVTHIRIKGSNLTRVTLPSNVTLQMGQLFFEGNAELAEIAGFDNVTVTPSSIQVQGADSVRITNNPLLSTCRAIELRDVFVAAGYSTTSMQISGNAADCTP